MARKHGVYPHSKESAEKRARRPVFLVSDKAHPIRGLLPEEIASFYASVNVVREKALAHQSALRKSARPQGAQGGRGSTVYPGIACRPTLR